MYYPSVWLSGGHNDVPERARVDPGGGEPRVRALQPEAHHRAEHTAARRAALSLRPALAHTGQAQQVIIIISLLLSPLLGHRPSLWITHKENGP
jgi:hypothetical protein